MVFLLHVMTGYSCYTFSVPDLQIAISVRSPSFFYLFFFICSEFCHTLK